jgi:hypothetical protein
MGLPKRIKMKNFNPKLASDWYKLIEQDAKHAATIAASTFRKLSVPATEYNCIPAANRIPRKENAQEWTLKQVGNGRAFIVAAGKRIHEAWFNNTTAKNIIDAHNAAIEKAREPLLDAIKIAINENDMMPLFMALDEL